MSPFVICFTRKVCYRPNPKPSRRPKIPETSQGLEWQAEVEKIHLPDASVTHLQTASVFTVQGSGFQVCLSMIPGYLTSIPLQDRILSAGLLAGMTTE